MATIQQSIDIKLPVRIVYSQLTQFEDYPQFMEKVEAVRQLDDTHLHWTTMMSNRPVEWDAEITEQEPDRWIAWHNTDGPTNAGRIEVQPAGPDASRVIFTLEAELEHAPGPAAGGNEEAMARQLKRDLACLKEFIEARGSETAAWRGEIKASQAAEQQDIAQINESTQSDNSLSRSADDGSVDDGRFSIAAEVNLDQQSDQARRVGQMPKDSSVERNGTMSAADAMGKAMQQDQQDTKEAEAQKPAVNRAVPPSE